LFNDWFGNNMKTTLYGILLLVIGFLVWFTLLPSWCNIEIFNQLYKTILTSSYIEGHYDVAKSKGYFHFFTS